MVRGTRHQRRRPCGYRTDGIEQGNFSNVKGVGAGVFKCKIEFGPGQRVYFGKDGDRLVILVGGGSKKRQAKDIAAAKKHWADYKQRKKQEME